MISNRNSRMISIYIALSNRLIDVSRTILFFSSPLHISWICYRLFLHHHFSIVIVSCTKSNILYFRLKNGSSFAECAYHGGWRRRIDMRNLFGVLRWFGPPTKVPHLLSHILFPMSPGKHYWSLIIRYFYKDISIDFQKRIMPAPARLPVRIGAMKWLKCRVRSPRI